MSNPLKKRLRKSGNRVKNFEVMKIKIDELIIANNKMADAISQANAAMSVFMAAMIVLKKKGLITDEDLQSELNGRKESTEGISDKPERSESNDEIIDVDSCDKPKLPIDESSGDADNRSGIEDKDESTISNFPLVTGTSDRG